MSREYPDHPRVAVGIVVLKDDEVLLIQRGKPPGEGTWSLPGGGVELGEPMAEAAIREVREETGVEIEIGPVIDAVDSIRLDARRQVRFHYAIIDFAATWKSGEPTAGDDALQVAWVPVTQLARYELWDKMIDVIHKARSMFNHST